ncbi:hypothetical protein Ajs_3439 [Acidovorax sp. JS42]|nr:hypothetical protein Ajs_3439 [Acidovorax sp. JS42]
MHPASPAAVFIPPNLRSVVILQYTAISCELLEAVPDHTQARILDLAPHLGVDQGSLTDSGQRGSASMGRLMGLGAAIRQYGVCIVDILKSKHTF